MELSVISLIREDEEQVLETSTGCFEFSGFQNVHLQKLLSQVLDLLLILGFYLLPAIVIFLDHLSQFLLFSAQFSQTITRSVIGSCL